jgi:hypothetical protein
MSFVQEALREWAWIVGADRPDDQWLLSDYDSWEPNPHYTGPDQGHPEDHGIEDYDESMDGDFDSAMASAGFGTDEDYGNYGCDEFMDMHEMDSPTDFDEAGPIDDIPDWGE